MPTEVMFTDDIVDIKGQNIPIDTVLHVTFVKISVTFFVTFCDICPHISAYWNPVKNMTKISSVEVIFSQLKNTNGANTIVGPRAE